jgi:hypothetical protein
MLQDILTTCRMTPPLNFHFEFTVQPPKGQGKPSHTDLMIQSGSRCLAIEAKWTEPIYKTVSAWLGAELEDSSPQNQSGQPTNREEVLAGWLALLKPHVRREVTISDFVDCVYQMVHRAASACQGLKHPQLAYVKFTPSQDARAGRHDEYMAGLELLHRVLGSPKKFLFFLVEIQIAPTEAFRSIEKLPKGESTTAICVRNALRDSNLFEFVSYRISRIGSSA